MKMHPLLQGRSMTFVEESPATPEEAQQRQEVLNEAGRQIKQVNDFLWRNLPPAPSDEGGAR
jgi:hypothetical protein